MMAPGVLEQQPSPPPRVSAPSSSAAAACIDVDARTSDIRGITRVLLGRREQQRKKKKRQICTTHQRENRFGDGDFGGKTKRLYSKSLGTDGGLKAEADRKSRSRKATSC